MSAPVRRRGSRGAVTAELVMALPMLVAVTMGLAWLLSLASAQVRLVDAARETARAVARGDDPGQAVALGRRVAPDGTAIGVAPGAEIVEVRASVRVSGPGGLFRIWPGVTLDATAVASREPEP